MSFIAQRLSYFDSSDFRKAVLKQQLLKNPIDLSIGIPEELTPEHVKAAGIRAIQQDKTIYTPANGIFELREALALKLRNENGIFCSADTVTIVPGLTTGQLLVYLATLDPGDEIVVFDPYYPPYPHLASMVGAHVVYVPTKTDFQPDLPALKRSITNRTKMIVVNSPNNPSGAVYPEKTLREIASIAEKHNILIISDEIYEHFIYEGKHFSIGSIYHNTITMNGFSKEFAMTGWRVGYITGPPEIINAINELQQYAVMSSSSIGQHAALGALVHSNNRPKLTQKYREKRDYLLVHLEKMGLPVEGAQGAFFAFIQTPRHMEDLEFVERATDQGLIVVPGRAFSRNHNYFRISYGADMATLKRGVEALQKTMAALK